MFKRFTRRILCICVTTLLIGLNMQHILANENGTGKLAVIKDFYSKTRKRNIKIYVLLPPGYDQNKSETYPVVYFLHGMGGYSSLIRNALNGLPGKDVDKKNANLNCLHKWSQAMLKAKIPPFIWVSPEEGRNNEKHSFGWANPENEKMIIHELIPFIEKKYRAKKERKFRSISGFSMGGRGASYIAARNPSKFSSVVMWAPAWPKIEVWEERKKIIAKNPLRVMTILGGKDHTINSRNGTVLMQEFHKRLPDITKTESTIKIAPDADHRIAPLFNYSGVDAMIFLSKSWK